MLRFEISRGRLEAALLRGDRLQLHLPLVQGLAPFGQVGSVLALRPGELLDVRAVRGEFLALDPQLVRAELVSEVVSVQPGRPFWVAVRLGMKEGWHVNWINPGDAGLAPHVAWVLPEGFTAGDIQWPYPERFVLPELLILGYKKNVLLMVEIRPPADLAANRVELQARVEWLACREACIPGEARLA